MEQLKNKKYMGLYSSEFKTCGCEIRQYTGGKVLLIGCENHDDLTEYICPTCGQHYSKKNQLKKCQWSHAL